MKTGLKRILSFSLAVAMMVTSINVPVFADVVNDNGIVVENNLNNPTQEENQDGQEKVQVDLAGENLNDNPDNNQDNTGEEFASEEGEEREDLENEDSLDKNRKSEDSEAAENTEKPEEKETLIGAQESEYLTSDMVESLLISPAAKQILLKELENEYNMIYTDWFEEIGTNKDIFVYYVQDGAWGKDALHFATLSDSSDGVIPQNSNVVKEYLQYCQKIVFHDGITEIPNDFLNFESKDVDWGNFEFDEVNTHLNKYVEVVLADSVKTIGDRAFYGCEKINEMNFNKVESVGKQAFARTSHISSIDFGTNLKSIGKEAFADISLARSNVEITIPSTVEEIGEGAFKNSDFYVITIEDGVEAIPDYAFAMDESKDGTLKEITIPDSVKTIGKEAFRNCFNSDYYNCQNSNESILNIGKGITTIAEDAFKLNYSCFVNYNGTVADWCNIEFKNATANPMVNTIKASTSSESNRYLQGYCKFTFNDDDNTTIGSSTNEENTPLIIPDGVTEIKDYAFIGYGRTPYVEIPASVRKIGKGAFAYGDTSNKKVYCYSKDYTINSLQDTSSLIEYIDDIQIKLFPVSFGDSKYLDGGEIYGFPDMPLKQAADSFNSSLTKPTPFYDTVRYMELEEGQRDYTQCEYSQGELRLNIVTTGLGIATVEVYENDSVLLRGDESKVYYNLFGDRYSDIMTSRERRIAPYKAVVNGKAYDNIPRSLFTKFDRKVTIDGKEYTKFTLENVEFVDFKTGAPLSNYFAIEKCQDINRGGMLTCSVLADSDESSMDYQNETSSTTVNGSYKGYLHTGNTYYDAEIDYSLNEIGFYPSAYAGADIYANELREYSTSVGGRHEVLYYCPVVHVGEDIRFVIGFPYNEDGYDKFVPLDKYAETHPDVEVNWEIEYYDKDSNGNERIIKDTEHQYAELVAESDVYENGYSNWITAKSVPSEEFKYCKYPDEGYNSTGTGRAYVHVTVSDEAIGNFELRIPFWIKAAEPGVKYRKWDTPAFYTSKAEALQAIRDNMVARTGAGTGTWTDFSVTVEPTIEIEEDEIFDTNAERAGMKPNEGDYLAHTFGLRDSTSGDFTWLSIDYVTVDGVNCKKYMFTPPFVTTSVEEQFVDDEINRLLNDTNALANYKGEGVSKEAKAKAAYDWVTKNVSGFVGSKNSAAERMTPINHTPYATLKWHYGTCEAFAVLYERLCRELGVKSKVIAGTDANAHSYNIVQLDDGYWYYVDTSGKIWKKTYTEFTRTTEQSRYRTVAFIRNYISKIKGYTGASPDTVSVLNAETEELLLSAGSFLEVQGFIFDKIDKEIELDGYPSTKYLLKLNKDVTSQSIGELDYASSCDDERGQSNKYFDSIKWDYSKYVTLDLNGHKITGKSNTDIAIRVNGIKNGTITTGQYGDLYLVGNTEEIFRDRTGPLNYSTYENVNFKSTNGSSYFYVTGGVDITPSCTMGSFTEVNIFRGSKVNCNFSTTYLIVGLEGIDGDNEVLGNVTAKYFINGLPSGALSNFREFSINENMSEISEAEYDKTKETGGYQYTTRVNNLSVTSGTKLARGSYLQIHGESSLNGPLYVCDNAGLWNKRYVFNGNIAQDASMTLNMFPAAIEIAREYKGETLVSTGKLSTNGAINEYEIGDGKNVYGDMVYGLPGINIYPINVNYDENYKVTSEIISQFKKGDVIANMKVPTATRYDCGTKTIVGCGNPDAPNSNELMNFIKVRAIAAPAWDDGQLWCAQQILMATLEYHCGEMGLTRDQYLAMGADVEGYFKTFIYARSMKDLISQINSKTRYVREDTKQSLTLDRIHVLMTKDTFLVSDWTVPSTAELYLYSFKQHTINEPVYTTESCFDPIREDNIQDVVNLDLRGFSINASKFVEINNGVNVVSSVAKAGTLKTTYNGGEWGTAVTVFADKVKKNADEVVVNENRLNNVNVSAANGRVVFTILNSSSLTVDEQNELVANTVVKSGSLNIDAKNVMFDANIVADKLTTKTSEYMIGQAARASVVASSWTDTGKGVYVEGTVDASTINITKLKLENVNSMAVPTVIADNLNTTTLTMGVGACVDAAVLTLPSTGKLEVADEAEITVRDKATIYGLTRDDATTRAYYSTDFTKISGKFKLKMPQEGANISINSVYTGNENYAPKAEISLVNDEGENVDPVKNTKLFSTIVKNFPVKNYVFQNASIDCKYKDIYQDGNAVYVGARDINIKTITAAGEEVLLETFSKWADASSYIEKLANANSNYVVELSGDVTVNGALTLPAKAKSIEYRGVPADSSRKKLKFASDLKLTTNVKFTNLSIENSTYNATTATHNAYSANYVLNGFDLTFDNADNYTINKITGNSKNTLTVDGSTIFAGGGIAAVKNMNLSNGAIVNVANTIDVKDTLTMNDANIYSDGGAINVVNLCTNSNKNAIQYKGIEKPASFLTITGNVYSDVDEMAATIAAYKESDAAFRYTLVPVNSEALNGKAYDLVRKGAIRVYANSLSGVDEKYDMKLLNATKATAGWFVVDTMLTKDVSSISAPTHRSADGKTIRYGAIGGNVMLESKDSETDVYDIEGTFATLQEAFSEIDRLNNINKEYRVSYIVGGPGADDNFAKATTQAKNLTFPSKAAKLIVTANQQNEIFYSYGADVFFDNAIAIKCNTEFDRVNFSSKRAFTVAIDKFTVEMNGCNFGWIETVRFDYKDGSLMESSPMTTISGNGVAGTSKLILNDTTLAVNGNVQNIGTVEFKNGSTLASAGTINIGDVAHSDVSEAHIVGTATVARKSMKYAAYDPDNAYSFVTAITPAITFNGKVPPQKPVDIQLMEKTTPAKGTTIYRTIALGADETDVNYVMDYFKDTVKYCQVAKIPNLPANNNLELAGENTEGLEDENYFYTKRAQFLTYALFDDSEAEAELVYTDANGNEVTGYYATFADAVTEINNLKVKRDYKINVLNDVCGTFIDSATQPRALTMPTAAYVQSLTIAGSDVKKIYYTGNITLTTNTTLENVEFVQCAKAAANMEVSDGGKIIRNNWYPIDEIGVSDGSDIVENHYPAMMTFSIGGYKLDTESLVEFNTPVKFTGNASGIFNVNGDIVTNTNDYDKGEWGVDSLIAGRIESIGTVNIPADADVAVLGFIANKYAKATYTNAAVTGVANLNNKGTLVVSSQDAKEAPTADVKITNLTMDGDASSAGVKLESYGKINITNVTLTGAAAANAPEISACTDFNITGTLTNATNYGRFVTRLNTAKQPVPYLNVAGTIFATAGNNKVEVEVLPNINADVEDIDAPVTLDGAGTASTKYQAQLLTTKNGKIGQFRPSKENLVEGNDVEFSDEELDGYILVKTGANIYVFYGTDVTVALVNGNYEGKELGAAVEANDVIGYYTTFAEAVAEANAINNVNAEYTFMILKDLGTFDAESELTGGISLAFPSKAKKVYVCTAVEQGEATINFTNNLTLLSDLSITDVKLAPVGKATVNRVNYLINTALSVNTGKFTLDIGSVSFGDVDDEYVLGTGKADTIAGFKDITGTKVNLNGDLDIYGQVKLTDFNVGENVEFNILANQPINVTNMNMGYSSVVDSQGTGAVNVTKLVMDGNATLVAQNELTAVRTGGAINIKTLVNGLAAGKTDEEANANAIYYGQSNKNVTLLTIGALDTTAENQNSQKILLDMRSYSAEYDSAEAVKAYALNSDKAVTYKENLVGGKPFAQITLNDTRKIANIANISSDKFNVRINGNNVGGAVPSSVVTPVKANKSLYLEDLSSFENLAAKVAVSLAYYGENAEITGTPVWTSEYIDWAQAVTEINNQNIAKGSYKLSIYDYTKDTVVTDAYRRAALSTPADNKASNIEVTTKLAKDDEQGGCGYGLIEFTGAVTLFGKYKFKNIVLSSLTNNKEEEVQDFAITLKTNSSKALTAAEKASELTLDESYAICDAHAMQVMNEGMLTPVVMSKSYKGYFSNITGVKGISKVNVKNRQMVMTGGFSNVDVNLENGNVFCKSATTINKLAFSNTAGQDSRISIFGTGTIADVDVSGMTGKNALIRGKLLATNGLPTITISGRINGITADRKLAVTQIPKDTLLIGAFTDWAEMRTYYGVDPTYQNELDCFIEDGATELIGKAIIKATREDADSFVLEGTENNPEDPDKKIYYKDVNNNVICDSLADMRVELTKAGSAGKSYAKCYYDAVKMIDSMNDPAGEYKIKFINADINVDRENAFESIFYTSSNNTIGGFTLPAKGKYKSLTIDSDYENNEGIPVLEYTGNISLTGDLRLDNVGLSECSYNKTTKAITVLSKFTPVLNGFKLTVGGNASTYEEYWGNTYLHRIMLGSVSGAGTFRVETNNSGRDAQATVNDSIYCMGNITCTNFEYVKEDGDSNSYYTYVEGTFNVTNATIIDELESRKDMTIGTCYIPSGALVVSNAKLNIKKAIITEDQLSNRAMHGNYMPNYNNSDSLVSIIATRNNTLTLNEIVMDHTKTYPNNKAPRVEISCPKVMTIGDISATSSVVVDDNKQMPVFRINTYTTQKANKTVKTSNSQLSITGDVKGDANVELVVVDNYYDASGYRLDGILWKEQLNSLNMTGKASSFQKLASVSKAETTNFELLYVDNQEYCNQSELLPLPQDGAEFKKLTTVMENGDEKPASLIKYDGGLYVSTMTPVVELEGYDDANYSNKVYTGQFVSWDQAMSEIDRIGTATPAAGKPSYFKVALLDDLGDLSIPLKSLRTSNKAKNIRITTSEQFKVGNPDSRATICLALATWTLGTNVWLDDVDICSLKQFSYKEGRNVITYYAQYPIALNISNYELRVSENILEKDSNFGPVNMISSITGNAKSTLVVDDGKTFVSTGAINSVGTIKLGANAKLSANSALKDANDVTLESGSKVHVMGDVNVKNLIVNNGATVEATNITSTGTMTIDNARIFAVADVISNSGKLSLNNVVVRGAGNSWFARQSSSGVSQITVNGTITGDGYLAPANEAEAPISVGVMYNAAAAFGEVAKLYEGMTLLTAAKASDVWFKPMYNRAAGTYNDLPRLEEPERYLVVNPTRMMGAELIKVVDEERVKLDCLYKSGKNIVYGKKDNLEVSLTAYTNYVLDESGQETYFQGEAFTTEFATFEEAVTEINNLNLFKVDAAGKATKKNADYLITLNKDVEIGNTANNGKYNALALPTKASFIDLRGDVADENGLADIEFSGALTFKTNTMAENINFVPMKTVGTSGVATAANWALGNFRVELNNAKSVDSDGKSLITNISGNKSLCSLVLVNDELDVNGNATAIHELRMIGNSKLAVNGNLDVYELDYESHDADVSETAVVSVNGATANTSILGLYMDNNAEKPDRARFIRAEKTAFNVNGATLTRYETGTNGKQVAVKYNVSVLTGEGCSPLEVTVNTAKNVVGMKILYDKYMVQNGVSNKAYYVVCVNDFTSVVDSYLNGMNLMAGK